MPPLSIIIWLPLACGLLGAFCRCSDGARPSPRCRPARRQARRPARADRAPGGLALLGSLAALGLAIGYIADYNAGHAGLHARHRRRLDRRPRHPLQARRRRPERVPPRADDAAVRGGRARGEPARTWDRAAALLLHLHARRVGGARRVPRAGPRAVRRVLRPDADPVLLPHRASGAGDGPPTRESDDQARHLHARRLAADARGGGRDRRARGAARRAHQVRARARCTRR